MRRGLGMVSAADIRQGLERGEFVFHYQPKAAFLTGRVTGAEALIRWERDGGALVLPDAFIPVAQAHGLLPDITQVMFPRLLEDFRSIRDAHGDIRVALNVTAQDLDTPRLLALVREAVGRGAIDASRLEIEITESAVVSGSEESEASLAALTDAGIQLAMDDYGVGFSSLATLNRLPFAAIKMDQSFVLRMLRSAKSATLVKASVAMAQMLGVKTVIEGIESEGVYRSLLHCGCTEGQGYWISPPLAPGAYLALLGSGRRWPASPVGLLRMARLSHTWQQSLLMDEVFAYLGSQRCEGLTLQGLHTGHRECTLGCWYYGAGQCFADDPDFQALEAPHRSMHQACERIFIAIEDQGGREILKGLLQELTANSSRVADCLQRLETRLLVEELAQASAAQAG
jgi:EAL domain-containing protein (putative c-di-GMP-specific phosphodiesterase class I)